jgi:hypothetical protein
MDGNIHFYNDRLVAKVFFDKLKELTTMTLVAHSDSICMNFEDVYMTQLECF